MRRFILLLLAITVLAGVPLYLFLRDTAPSLSLQEAEDVMRLAAQQSRSLQSARLNGDGSFRLEGGALPASGTAELQGILQNAGDSVQMSVAIDALVAPGGNRGQTFRLRGAGETIVIGKKDLYFRVQSLSTEPDQSLFQPELLVLLLDKWWMVPGDLSGQESAVPGGTMTPPPTMLRAQAQVVRVLRNRGSVSLDGSAVHHFEVAVDPDKLLAYLQEVAATRNETFDRAALSRSIAGLQAQGEMWIDAQTYVLRQVTWNIREFPTEQGMFSASFTVRLSDIDSAPPVTPPADAQPFAPASFFGIDAESGTLSPAQREQYRSLIE